MSAADRQLAGRAPLTMRSTNEPRWRNSSRTSGLWLTRPPCLAKLGAGRRGQTALERKCGDLGAVNVHERDWMTMTALLGALAAASSVLPVPRGAGLRVWSWMPIAGSPSRLLCGRVHGSVPEHGHSTAPECRIRA